MSVSKMSEYFDWDAQNWSKVIPFWESNSKIDLSACDALELGGRDGGLSLYLAERCRSVICSDLDGPSENARIRHAAHGFSEKIIYANIDAAQITYPDNTFDLVLFKSVMGALRTYERQQKMIDEIYRVLKPGGELWFAENLVASPLHMMARRRFIRWSSYWRYLKADEIKAMARNFQFLSTKPYGFWAAFGRSEMQRMFLERLDSILDPLIPSAWKYILFAFARK